MVYNKTCISCIVIIMLLLIFMLYLTTHIDNNCIKYNCKFEKTLFNNINSCKITVLNSTIYKGCTKLYNDCPLNQTICYIYDNNPCPIYDCYNTKYGKLIKTSLFLILLNLIIILVISCKKCNETDIEKEYNNSIKTQEWIKSNDKY